MPELDEAMQRFFGAAFDRAAAQEANVAIERVRGAAGGDDEALSYEVVAPEHPSVEWFQSKLLPRLIYHLESLAIRPPGTGVFLSIFRGDELLFIHARDALAFAGELLGATGEELYARFGTGELRTAIQVEPEPSTRREPPLALPGPAEGE